MPPPTSRQVIAGLQLTPLLSISEMQSALDADRAAHGIYAWASGLADRAIGARLLLVARQDDLCRLSRRHVRVEHLAARIAQAEA